VFRREVSPIGKPRRWEPAGQMAGTKTAQRTLPSRPRRSKLALRLRPVHHAGSSPFLGSVHRGYGNPMTHAVALRLRPVHHAGSSPFLGSVHRGYGNRHSSAFRDGFRQARALARDSPLFDWLRALRARILSMSPIGAAGARWRFCSSFCDSTAVSCAVLAFLFSIFVRKTAKRDPRLTMRIRLP
jgi:hypothetical protein